MSTHLNYLNERIIILLFLFCHDTKKKQKRSRSNKASPHLPTHLPAVRPGQRSFMLMHEFAIALSKWSILNA